VPWIGIYVEISDFVDVYNTSLKNYDEKYRVREGKAIDDWGMRKKDKEEYEKDHNIRHIRIEFHIIN
jgi:hypothetical protein